MSRHEALAFLNIAHFFDHFFVLLFPSAAIALATAWQMSYGDTLALGTPVYVMFAVGTLPAGWLGDRFDRLLLIGVFFVGCGASSLLVATSSGSTELMIGLGSLGLFASLYHPVGLAHVPDIAERSGRALAVNGVFGNLGLAAAAVVTGITAGFFGWRTAFVMPGLVSIIFGAWLLVRLQRKGGPRRVSVAPRAGETTSTTRSVQFRVVSVVCVSALFGGFVFNAITVSLPKLLDERLAGLQGDLAWIGASTGLIFAVAAFAQLPVGELLDRFGARRIMIALLSTQAVLLALLSQLHGWWVLPLTLLLVTMIFAEIPITSWLLGRFIPSQLRSRAVSVEYVLSLGVGSAAIPLLAGMHAASMGFSAQLPVLAGLALVVLAAACSLPGQHRLARQSRQPG